MVKQLVIHPSSDVEVSTCHWSTKMVQKNMKLFSRPLFGFCLKNKRNLLAHDKASTPSGSAFTNLEEGQNGGQICNSNRISNNNNNNKICENQLSVQLRKPNGNRLFVLKAPLTPLFYCAHRERTKTSNISWHESISWLENLPRAFSQERSGR